MQNIINRTILSKLINSSLLLSLLMVSSCLDPIELKIPKGFDNALVIQAELIKGNPSTFNLTVSRLFDFTLEGIGKVNVREVIMEDSDGNKLEIEAFGTGVYKETFGDDSPISIEVGKSYKLYISTFDGRKYESNFEPILPTPQIDSLSYEIVNRELILDEEDGSRFDSIVRFRLNTPLSAPNQEEQVDLKWNVRRVFKISDTPIEFGVFQKTCYVTENIGVTQVRTFNGSEYNQPRLENYDVIDQLLDFHFSEGYYLEVIQQSLSKGAYEYWSRTAQVLDRNGDMFEAPAGKVSSNFVNVDDPNEEAFGYFYATTETIARIYVSPEFAGNPGALCPPTEPPPPTGGCPLDICCDCLSQEISTVIKPSYWVE